MKTLIIPLLILAGPVIGEGAVSVFWITNPAKLLTSAGTPLSNGVTGVPGDGMLVEGGYYSGSSASAPFGGSWVTLATCSIGDFVAYDSSGGVTYRTETGTGSFNLRVDTNQLLPNGILFAFRFYDSPVISETSHFNAVSSASWIWTGSTFAKANLDETFDEVWQGGADSAFRTTLPVPEPGVAVLLMAGGAGWVWWRRRAGGVMAAGRCR
jgi:hypothetical protein